MATARETYRVLAFSTEDRALAQIYDRINRTSPVDIIVTDEYLDFLEQVTRLHTHLLILDADLLHEHLAQLIRLVRSLERECAILVLLSEHQAPLGPEVLSLGILTYLTKPLSVPNAVRIIHSALIPAASPHRRAT